MPQKLHRRSSTLLGLLVLASTFGANMALADVSQLYGRWTVKDNADKFSSKGMLYKTIDVASCGNDFCGVSVDAKNQCGPTLFRFYTTHATNEPIVGHGKWGDLKKKLIIEYVDTSGEKDNPSYVMLGLGADDVDLTGREGSMPTFAADYQITGQATCTAK